MWRTNVQNQVSTCVTGSPVPLRAAHARVLWSGHRSGRPRTAERVLGLPAEERWRPGWQITEAEVRSRLEDVRSYFIKNISRTSAVSSTNFRSILIIFASCVVTYFIKNISRTSAVSSTNFGSILIFASCVITYFIKIFQGRQP